MKFENTQTAGFEAAVRGMRNPMNSWDKSDSDFENGQVRIGLKDLELAQRLIRGGSEHRKFLRQIQVWVDITAPLYWWKEADTYKVGTVANSCSTMHKLAGAPITLDCFETKDYCPDLYRNYVGQGAEAIIDFLETLRKSYLETKDKRFWKELIRWLPESWLQKRTLSMSYENLYSMVRQRRGHKLTEWAEDFMSWAESLPYAKELIFYGMEESR